MKLLIINDQFERGGAGRVTAILCNELYNRGYSEILVADFQHWAQKYELLPDIKKREIITKTLSGGFFSKFKKWVYCIINIRKYIIEEKPDIIIAVQSMMFLCTYIANFNKRTPIIAVDHTSFGRKINPIVDFVRFYLYGKAEGLSILTKKDYKLLGNKYPKKKVIYNPLSFPLLNYKTKRRKNILCVGRLEVWKIKGFDIIINIWSQIQEKYPDWTLEIAGTGTEESVLYLNNLIEKLGLKERVFLLGQVDDMKALYAQSSIFVLSSRVEGFPMVLMEAMSQGCACIAFSVQGAANEMLTQNSGFVIDDGDILDLQQKLTKLIEDNSLRENYGYNAIDAVSKFSVKTFVDEWENLIESVLFK